MIRRPPRSTQSRSSAASDVYKRQTQVDRRMLDIRLLFLAILTLVVGSRINIRIPRVKGFISVSDTFIFLVLLLFGKEFAALLAAAEALCSSLRFSRSKSTILFNTAVMGSSTFLAGSAVHLLVGESAFQHPFSAEYVIAISLLACLQSVSYTHLTLPTIYSV